MKNSSYKPLLSSQAQEFLINLYYDLLPSDHVLKEAIMESLNQDGDNTKKIPSCQLYKKIQNLLLMNKSFNNYILMISITCLV